MEYIIERIKSLPDESLKEVTDFIEFLETKRKRVAEEKEKEGEGDDPLARVIGICEGPSDMAERQNNWIFMDTWAWLALSNRKDTHHELAKKE